MATNGNDSITGASGNDNNNCLDGDDTIIGNSGDDTLDGDAGDDSLVGNSGTKDIKGGTSNDTIDGGSDNDKLEGEDRDDVIFGGYGDDEIKGGDGNDTIDGGGGSDKIEGGNGADLIDGGDGDDTITGQGNDMIEGGAGHDKISVGSDSATVYGDEGHDTITGGSGNDRLFGGDDDDSIKGGSGDDTIIGGDGDDYIETGSGNDVVEAGAGDDTIKAGSGNETFVYRDGHGSDVINGFGSNDVIAFDMAEISSYQDMLDRMSGGDNTLITFDNGETLQLSGFERDDVNASNFSFSAGPVFFLAGTLMLTERGGVAIEDLRPDDILWTKDHGWQALRLVVRETMVFKTRDDKAKPILIPAGALGENQPQTDLILSPQHRVLQVIEETGEEVLVPAIKLIGHKGIRRMRGKKRAEYLNVVMERHSVIQAAGCWVESLLVTSRSLSRQTKAARRMLDHAIGMEPARRIERKGVRPRRLKSA
ncbi:Hint domain-containing protein [Rhodobacteraceae bacterium N5(2021)]|uniref:Hint domain-containing protein n=1 Tax=Gymnodinialimonas phycosphaerae TaxID=2841589 RepID=A0A975TTI5_9RHOB|nr:Hint domain-containing protein [Gymnodinialimonas phycosphaerae]MBY4894772.1 Hint domain-containing protein [Gymnodinialimonas phycosphaerae]